MSTEAYAALIEPVARFFFGDPNHGMSSKHELRYGSRGSLSIDLRSGTWFDHERQEGGGLLDLVARECHFEKRESPRWLDEHGFHLPDDDPEPKANGSAGPPRGKIVATYPYHDENGEVLFEVVRYDPKNFRQRRPDGRGGYIWSVRGVPFVPYRVTDISEAISNGHPIYFVEGEKDADALRALGLTATCNAGGVGKWRDELSDNFFGSVNAVIIPDNDPQAKHPKTGELMCHEDGRPIRPGHDHAHAVAQSLLRGNAKRVRFLDLARHWRQMPPKGDVYDWLTRGGGTREKLDELTEQAPDWSFDLMNESMPLAQIIMLRPFPIDEPGIDPRAWNTPGLLLRKHLTIVVAPSGAGKSLLTLQIGIHSALKMEWAGWRPRAAYRVLFINSEDDYDEMRRRLAAACRPEANGGSAIDQEGLRDQFLVAADTEADDVTDEISNGAVIAKIDPRKKTMIRTPRFRQLIQTIRDNKVDIVFVDPFAETFEGDENSNNDLKWAGKLWRDVARLTNTAICLVHHTRKYASAMAGDADAARGAGALIGIARIVSTLFPMTVKEAEAMGITNGDRTRYLRYDDAKANQNLISPHARWFEKPTIKLDNERQATEDHDYIPGDEVGYLRPWKPKEGPMLLEADINRFFEHIDRGIVDDAGQPTGEYWTFEKGGRGNKRYIGEEILQKLELETLAQAEDLLKGWKGDKKGCVKRLFEIQYRSPSARRPKQRVVSELSEDCPKNKKPAQESETNGELFESNVTPFKQPESKRQRFRVVADCSSETTCLVCRNADGNVKRIKDSYQPGSQTETLHVHCAAQYFIKD